MHTVLKLAQLRWTGHVIRLSDKRLPFSKLQYNSLAFVAGFKRATDEGSLPEIAQYSPYYLPLNVCAASKGSNLYILFQKKVFYGELQEGKRSTGGWKKRYKDTLKAFLKDFDIPIGSWEQTAQERSKWRGLVNKGVTLYNKKENL